MCTCDRDSFINFYIIIIFNMDAFLCVYIPTLSVVLGVCVHV